MLDEKYMRLAIQIAQGVKGQTTPNPPVGAVVVKEGNVIGVGAHLQYGEAHAEVVALDMAGKEAYNAVLYVSLEPCCHHGKTAPCTDLIIQKGIKRVVIACRDQNEKVAGHSIQKLKAAGIEVTLGVLEKEAEKINKEFFYTIKTSLPFVTVKTAMSLDGKIATHTGESKWITSERARKDAHQYRHGHDAILVGVQTVLSDNPHLTTRIPGGKNPIRIILDTQLRTPIDANVVADNAAETYIFVGENASVSKKEAFTKKSNVRIITMADEVLDIEKVLINLTELEIGTVLVEGGGKINDAFLRKDLIQQLVVYIAPIIIGGEKAKTPFAGEGFASLDEALPLQVQRTEMIGNEIKVIAIKEEENVYRNY